MALPMRYTLRHIVVRRTSVLFTAMGVAMTVAVFAGILALRIGFEQVYATEGRDDIAVYLRPGAASEGESALQREQVNILKKEREEILRDEQGNPLAAAESFLAVYMDMVDGGRTNVPLRGIEPASIDLQGEQLQLVDGRWMNFGADEVVVGKPLTERMQNCRIGDTLVINMTPFEVVGVYEHTGAHPGEVWGGVERMLAAVERAMFSRVVARVRPDTDFAALAEELASDERVPMKFVSEKENLEAQTAALGVGISVLASILTVVMGVAAVLGSINTMLAAVASRTHEIGVLLAIGYGRVSVFLAFLFEAALTGVIGGALGLLIILPFDGAKTGLVNWNTFTDVSFAFRVTPDLVLNSFVLAFLLGLIGGAIPAARAAWLEPVAALRSR